MWTWNGYENGYQVLYTYTLYSMVTRYCTDIRFIQWLPGTVRIYALFNGYHVLYAYTFIESWKHNTSLRDASGFARYFCERKWADIHLILYKYFS